MKRRDFLLKTGLLGPGGTNVLAACGASEAADSQVRSRRSPADAATKKVLITSAHRELAQVVAAELSGDYQVRLTAPMHVEAAHDFVKSALNHDELTNLAVRGVDAIVPVAEPLSDVGDAEGIDYQTRCTYNLLCEAVKEDVRPVVYLGSLRMMSGYDESLQVDEDWRPLPTPASGGLSDCLGEFTCREFAREGRLDVIVLRLGNVVSAEALGEETSNSACVDPRDVAQAVSCALTKLLAEHELSATVSPADQVRLGRMAGAQLVLTGSVTAVGGKLQISAHLLDVATRRVAQSAKVTTEIDRLVQPTNGGGSPPRPGNRPRVGTRSGRNRGREIRTAGGQGREGAMGPLRHVRLSRRSAEHRSTAY